MTHRSGEVLQPCKSTVRFAVWANHLLCLLTLPSVALSSSIRTNKGDFGGFVLVVVFGVLLLQQQLCKSRFFVKF
jgi:hypothetical protein